MLRERLSPGLGLVVLEVGDRIVAVEGHPLLFGVDRATFEPA